MNGNSRCVQPQKRWNCGVLRASAKISGARGPRLYCSARQSSGAISSVVERLLHTQEVAGSNPASRTICGAPPVGGAAAPLH